MTGAEQLPLIARARTAARESDIAYTPAWVTRALLQAAPPPTDIAVIEPAAGIGAIVDQLELAGYSVFACEIREECQEDLDRTQAQVVIGDWCSLAPDLGPLFTAPVSVVTNPPFSIAREMALACLECLPWVYMALLLRLNTLGSAPWADFWEAHPPSEILTLRHRPSFRGGGTDAAEYAWVVWRAGAEPMRLRPIGSTTAR